MSVILTPDELEEIARRVAREPLYSSLSDCRTAFADRRRLLGHITELERLGARALAVLGGPDLLDPSEARRLSAEQQDRRAELPDA